MFNFLWRLFGWDGSGSTPLTPATGTIIEYKMRRQVVEYVERQQIIEYKERRQVVQYAK